MQRYYVLTVGREGLQMGRGYPMVPYALQKQETRLRARAPTCSCSAGALGRASRAAREASTFTCRTHCAASSAPTRRTCALCLHQAEAFALARGLFSSRGQSCPPSS